MLKSEDNDKKGLIKVHYKWENTVVFILEKQSVKKTVYFNLKEKPSDDRTNKNKISCLGQ